MLVLLHIPRTAMRPVHNVVSNEGIHHFLVRSPQDFHTVQKLTMNNEDVRYYFILRDPIERVMREYFKEDRKCSIKEYFVDQSLHNVMCKFLLCSTDPVTDESFKRVVDIVKSGKVKYDVFYPEKTLYTTFKELTGIDMYSHPVASEYKLTKQKSIFTPQEMHFMIKELNEYDIKLFELLNV